MTRHFPLLLLLLAAALLTGCRSAKTATADGGPTTAADPALAYKQRVVSRAQCPAPALTARLGVDIEADGKHLSCNGQLRMRRDDVIQLSFTLPLIGTEVARMEFTPDGVLLVDRMNKQYVRGTYAQVPFLAAAALDFPALQALFWNQLFIPGAGGAALALDRFRYSASGDFTLLSLTDTPKLEYDFLTRTKTANLERVNVRSRNVGEKGELVWKYGSFSTFAGRPFPTAMQLQVQGVGHDLSLALSLSKLSDNADWETRTAVGTKYRQRRAEDLMKLLPL